MAIEEYRLALDPDIVPMVMVDPRGQSVHHLNVVLVDERDAVRRELSSRGIESGIHYPVPCHLERPYRGLTTERLPVVEEAAAKVLSLPLFPHMTSAHIDRVSSSVMDIVKGTGRGLV